MDESLKQRYMNDCMFAQQLIKSMDEMQVNESVQHCILQLQECFDLPITEASVLFLERRIQALQDSLQKNQSVSVDEGNSMGYMKVKKSQGGYIQTEEIKDIVVPNYDLPIMKQSSSLREYPDYIVKDQVVPISNTSSNLGSSHILMLSLLSFFFECLFLLLGFFLYR